jgi:histidinol-phosphate aminotransferase
MIRPKTHLTRYLNGPREEPPRVGKVVRLGRNEWTVPYPEAAVRDMLARITGDDLVAIPELEPFYARVGDYLDVERSRLLLCPGSDAGIKSVFEAYVESGDEVVFPQPTYHRYDDLCGLYGASRRPIAYAADLSFDVDELVGSISPATRLVVVVNPNNPTGTVLGIDELLRVLRRARECEALVLVDEAYHHFCSVTALPLLDVFDNLVVTRSFSKAFGMASARIGVLVADPAIIGELWKVKPRHEISGVAARIGEYVLDHPEIMREHVDQVNRSKSLMADALAPMGYRVMPSEAASVLIRLPDGADRAELVSQLMERGGYEVGAWLHEPLDRYIRVAVGPWEQMEGFVAAVRACSREMV